MSLSARMNAADAAAFAREMKGVHLAPEHVKPKRGPSRWQRLKAAFHAGTAAWEETGHRPGV